MQRMRPGGWVGGWVVRGSWHWEASSKGQRMQRMRPGGWVGGWVGGARVKALGGIKQRTAIASYTPQPNKGAGLRGSTG